MKMILAICRILVGSLLIVSGIVKANDALGFSYKLQDYFTDGVLGMEFLKPYTLIIAAVICIVEVIFGIALIFGLKARLISGLNLLMMLFFTFLTFYSAYFNKVTDCGCFGDALKLTPWQSFAKDVVLLALSLPLFIWRKRIFPNKRFEDMPFILASLAMVALMAGGVIGWWFPLIFSVIVFGIIFIVKRIDTNEWRLISLGTFTTLIFTVYCYRNLPIKDFRPYKVEANILKGMELGPNALPELVEYQWKFHVKGKDEIFTNTDGSYPQVEGDSLVGVETKTIREAENPPIHDFTIEKEGDETQFFLEQDKVLVVVAYDLDISSDKGFEAIHTAIKEAKQKGYKVIGLTASPEVKRAEVLKKHQLDFDFYFCDGTTLKTIVRSNPGVFVMDKATIKQKYHWRNISEITLE